MNSDTKDFRTLSSRSLRAVAAVVAIMLASSIARAQADFEKGFQAYQAYHGSEFDTVNLANGNLVLNIPLLSYEQRGGLPPIVISVRSNSTTFQSSPPFQNGPPDTKQHEVSSGVIGSPWGQPHVAISPGGLYWKEDRITTASKTGGGPEYLSRFVATDESGATHSLGEAIANLVQGLVPGIMYSVDDSGLMLQPASGNNGPVLVDRSGNTGGLMDPNGNVITLQGPCATKPGAGEFYNASLPPWEGYAYGTASASSVLDSVGRTIPNPTYLAPTAAYSCLVDLDQSYYPATASSDPSCPVAQVAGAIPGETGAAIGTTGLPLMASDGYYFPGQSNTTIELKFCYQKINVSAELPNVQRTATQINEVWPVLTGVILPNGTKWVFVYDNYGQVIEITLPTGATVVYAYGGSTSNMRLACGNPPGEIPVSGTPAWPFSNLMSSRMVTQRTLTSTSSVGSAVVQQWTYNSTIGSGWAGSPNQGNVTVTDAMGNDVVHSFSLIGTPAYGQPICGPYETNVAYYQGSSTAMTPVLIKQVATQYTSTGIDHANPTNFSNYIATNVLPSYVTTTLYDGAGGMQVQQDSYVYDKFGTYQDYKGTTYPFSFGQKLSLTESDFGAGSPGPILITSLFTNQWQSYWKYWAANLIDLPCLDTVFTGSYNGGQPGCTAPAPPSNQTSQTSFLYDEPAYMQGQGNEIGLQTTLTRWLKGGTSPSSHTVYGAIEGMPIEKIDPNGNTTFIQYDSTGLYPDKITHPQTGSVTHIEVPTYDDATGELLSNEDENQNTTYYQYDEMRRLLTTTYPDGGSETFTFTDSIPPSYFFSKTLTSTSAPYAETGLADTLGRKVQTQVNSDPLGTIYATTTYDTLGRVATKTNPFRSTGEVTYGVTTFTYDAIGRKTIQTQPDGSKQMWCYQNLATTAQTNCNAQAAKTGSGASNGSFVDFRDEGSHDWQRNSDGLGRLASVMEPNGSTNTPTMQTTYAYDVLGDLTGVTQTGNTSKDTARAARSFTYDSLARLSTANNPESGAVSYTYDANSNMLSRTQPLVNATAGTETIRYCYDALDRKTAEYTGSLVANCTSPSQITLANLISAYSYDTTTLGTPPNYAIGQLTDEQEYTSGTSVWERSPYQFDKMGRVLDERQCTFGSCAKYLSFGYTYDYAGNPLTATTTDALNGTPTTTGVATYTYDAVARLATLGVTSAFGEFSYNAKEYGPAGLTSASYGSVGLGSAEAMVLSRLYDKRMRVTDNTVNSAATQASATITLACINSGCTPGTGKAKAVIAGISVSASTNQTTLAALATSLASVINGTDGMPVTATASSNVVTLTAIEYGKDGEVSLTASTTTGATFTATASAANLGGDTSTTPYEYSLTYATNNNVTAVTDTIMGSWTYTYDTLNRLKEATAATGGIMTPFGTFLTQCWTYDGFGNRTGEGELTSGTTCPNPISGATHSNVALYNTSNRITSNSVNTFVYDDAGNITNDGINKYVYDLDGRICAVTTVASGGAITQYVYDAGGQRVAKGSLSTFPAAGSVCPAPTAANGFSLTGATAALFLRGALGEQQSEYDGSGNWRHTDIFAGGSLVATLNNNATTPLSFNFSDWLGTKRLQSNFTGATQNTWSSDPFGAYLKPLGSGTDSTERHFTGKERDNESGNEYFGARYYSSSVGRWMSPDPDLTLKRILPNPQRWNRYVYVLNRPLFSVDQDGAVDTPAQSAAINRVLGGDPTLLSVIIMSNNFSQRAFETNLNRGAFSSLKTGAGATLRGLAGEANVLDQFWAGGYAAMSQPLLKGVLPDISVVFPSFSLEIPEVGELRHHFDLPNVVTSRTGTIGSASLGTNIKFGFYEIKAGLSGSGIADGVVQISAMAKALKAGNIPGVAILLVDEGAWDNLSADQRSRNFQSVDSAGGYIQVQGGLNQAATDRAQQIVDAANAAH